MSAGLPYRPKRADYQTGREGAAPRGPIVRPNSRGDGAVNRCDGVARPARAAAISAMNPSRVVQEEQSHTR